VTRDPKYLAFISLFNRDRDYFECHEVMEELWLEEGRNPVLQGLLQAAVGLYHWDNNNRSGAVKLMTAARSKLAPALTASADLGLDIGALCGELDVSLAMLAERPADAPFRAFSLVVTDDGLAAEVAERERLQQA
jgi:predicted metal-dependent hydrolase